jgi:hypothetical protein
MPNDDCIKRSDALKAILGVSIYDTIEELEGARTIPENTWADGLWDAYKIIEEEVDAADVEPRQRWIPVTERLPEEGNIVMAYQPIPSWMKSGNGWIRIAVYTGKGEWREEAEYHNRMTLPVTHWMPLPEPPKEEEDAE